MVRRVVSEAPLLRTSLYERQKSLGARFCPFAGWEMPIQFSSILEEHHAVRKAAGLFDASHMGELELTGPKVLAELDPLVTNDVSRLKDGQAQYTVCCNERGTIIDDLIIYRFTETKYWIVCNASNRHTVAMHISSHLSADTIFVDRSDRTALLALQGPVASKILAAACEDPSIQDLPSFSLREISLAGHSVVAARTGYTGEDGFEIFCETDAAPEVWDLLFKHGSAQGLLPAGLAARDTLRLEAALSLYGNDIDLETTPLEAGLGWVVKLGHTPFLGDKALQLQKQQGIKKKLVGFEMVERGIARHGHPIKDANGKVIGNVTSGGPAPTLGKNIGLGYVPAQLATEGSELLIDIRGKIKRAKIINTPFYRSNNKPSFKKG